MLRLSILAIGALMGSLVASAGAELKTFVPNTGDFHVVQNWSPQGIPDADDRIIIPGGKLCNVTADAEVDTIEILSDGNGNGILNIKSDVTLTLDNSTHNCPSPGINCSTAPQHSIIDGVLNIIGDETGGDATLKIVNATHEFAGAGRIVGHQGPNISHIVIDTDLKLVNKLSGNGDGILGGMTITGLTGGTDRGILRNEGKVFASNDVVFSDDDQVVIDAGIEVTANAIWGTDCGATLEFKFGNTNLKGLFSDSRVNFDGGTLKFHETVRTCGDYERDGCGGLTFVAGAEFKYTGFTGNCDNPDTDGTSSDTPNNCSGTDQFYIVSENEAADCE